MGFWSKPIRCKNHRIGNNNSTEVHRWRGRESRPYKHYIEYDCEVCGREIREWQEDSIFKPEGCGEPE